MNVANLITLLRFPLLMAIVAVLYFGGAVGQMIDALLVIVLILMDMLDGIVARRRDEQSLIAARSISPPIALWRSSSGWFTRTWA